MKGDINRAPVNDWFQATGSGRWFKAEKRVYVGCPAVDFRP